MGCDPPTKSKDPEEAESKAKLAGIPHWFCTGSVSLYLAHSTADRERGLTVLGGQPVSTHLDGSCNLLTLLTIYCGGQVVLREELWRHVSRHGDRRVVSCVRVLNEVRVVSQVRGQVMSWRHG